MSIPPLAIGSIISGSNSNGNASNTTRFPVLNTPRVRVDEKTPRPSALIPHPPSYPPSHSLTPRSSFSPAYSPSTSSIPSMPIIPRLPITSSSSGMGMSDGSSSERSDRLQVHGRISELSSWRASRSHTSDGTGDTGIDHHDTDRSTARFTDRSLHSARTPRTGKDAEGTDNIVSDREYAPSPEERTSSRSGERQGDGSGIDSISGNGIGMGMAGMGSVWGTVRATDGKGMFPDLYSYTNGLTVVEGGDGKEDKDMCTTDDWVALYVCVSNIDRVARHGHGDHWLSIYQFSHMWKRVTSTHMHRHADLPFDCTAIMVMPVDLLCKNDYSRPFRFKYYVQKKSAHHLLGEFETCLQAVIDSVRTTSTFDILDSKGKSGGVVHTLIVVILSLTVQKCDIYHSTTRAITLTKYPRLFPDTTNELLYLQLSCKTLEKMDLFGKADAYLEFCKLGPNKDWEVVHQTEVFHDSLDPHFKPMAIRVNDLCAGNYDRPILIRCYDWNEHLSSGFIGQFQTTTRTLLTTIRKGRNRKFELVNGEKKAKNKKYVHSGLLCVKMAHIFTSQTELDVQSREYETKKTGKSKRDAFLHYLNSGATRPVFEEGKRVEDSKKAIATTRASKGYLCLVMRGERLAKMDLIGSSDPFVQIFRFRKDQSKWELIGATDHLINTLDPQWNPLWLKMKKLGGDDARLLIRCLDWNRSSPPALIGEFQLTLGELKNAHDQRYALIDEKKKEKSPTSYIHSGILWFYSVKLVKKPPTRDSVSPS